MTSGTDISSKKIDETVSMQEDRPNAEDISDTPDEIEIIEAIKKDIRKNGFKSGNVDDSWSIQVRIEDIKIVEADSEKLHVFAETGMSNDQMEVPHGFIDYFVLQKDRNGKWISEIVRKQ